MTDEEKIQRRRKRQAAYYHAHRTEKLAKNAAYRKANPEKIRAKNAAYRKANPEKTRAASAACRKARPEKVRAVDAARYKANRDKVRAAHAAWRKANPERFRASIAAWRKTHPDEVAIHSANHSARRRNAEGRHTAEEIRQLLARQKYRCAVCKKIIKDEYERDHVVPLSRGGSNYIRNIQLLCQKCNRKKSAKPPCEFMREMGYLI